MVGNPMHSLPAATIGYSSLEAMLQAPEPEGPHVPVLADAEAWCYGENPPLPY